MLIFLFQANDSSIRQACIIPNMVTCFTSLFAKTEPTVHYSLYSLCVCIIHQRRRIYKKKQKAFFNERRVPFFCNETNTNLQSCNLGANDVLELKKSTAFFVGTSSWGTAKASFNQSRGKDCVKRTRNKINQIFFHRNNINSNDYNFCRFKASHGLFYYIAWPFFCCF